MEVASALLAVQDGRCFYCAVEFDGPAGRGRWKPAAWTREHLYPKSQGFRLENNCVLSCAKCNRNKGSRTPGKNEVQRAYLVMQKAMRLMLIANGALPDGWTLDRTVIEARVPLAEPVRPVVGKYRSYLLRGLGFWGERQEGQSS